MNNIGKWWFHSTWNLSHTWNNFLSLIDPNSIFPLPSLPTENNDMIVVDKRQEPLKVASGKISISLWEKKIWSYCRSVVLWLFLMFSIIHFKIASENNYWELMTLARARGPFMSQCCVSHPQIVYNIWLSKWNVFVTLVFSKLAESFCEQTSAGKNFDQVGR